MLMSWNICSVLSLMRGHVFHINAFLIYSRSENRGNMFSYNLRFPPENSKMSRNSEENRAHFIRFVLKSTFKDKVQMGFSNSQPRLTGN